jgi:CPA2 family monovalent cation:H+ antiporter-2
LRGFFHGGTDPAEDPEEAHAPRLHSVTLAPEARARGKNLEELALETLGASVTAIRRGDVRLVSPGPETRLENGDVIVLLGTPEQLAAAEMRLLQG